MDAFLLYLICFGAGLLFTIVMAIFGEFVGHDGDISGAADLPGPGILSPMTIALFVTAFGGFGLIFHHVAATKEVWVSGPLATLGGLAVSASAVAVLRAVFRRTQSSSEGRVAEMVGLTGTVITPIPEDGVGEVAYVQGGSRYTSPARAENGGVIASGQTVRIARMVGTQCYVQKV